MSNKSLVVKISRTYPNLDDVTTTTTTTKQIPYQGQNEGRIDVPAATAPQVFSIPFGGIASATYVEVENLTDSDAQLKINGSAALQSLAPGSMAILTEASIPVGTEISAVSLTTEALTVGAGEIKYRVFGDPT